MLVKVQAWEEDLRCDSHPALSVGCEPGVDQERL